MKEKEVFMQVKELGDLFLYDVLLSYIYPRVFVCEDKYNCKYLFYEVSSNDNKDVWLVAKLTKNEYYSLVDGKTPVQQPYKNKSVYDVFSVSKCYGDSDNRIEIVNDGKDWIKKLPKNPVFAEQRTLSDYSQETLAVARETGATTFDIRFFPGTDRHFIQQNILSDLCAAMTTLTNSVFGKRRRDVLRVAMAQGSCIIRFSFPDQINLFNETDAANEMKVINSVLLSESLSDGLEKVREKTGFIKSYTKLLDAVRRTNSDVQFTTASPNSPEVQRVDLSKNDVENRYSIIKDIKRIDTETETYRGMLIALDTRTRKFKFQLKNGQIISGSVTKDFFNQGSFELPKEYSATIYREKRIIDSDNSIEEKVLLNHLST